MSVELGVPSRSIRYLNIHREGRQSDDTCNVDSRWSNPLLDKQDHYLVAISRFEVPLNRVPVTQKMDNCIEIFKYNNAEFTFMDDHGQVIENYEKLDFGHVEDLIQLKAMNPDDDLVLRQDGLDYLDRSETHNNEVNKMTTGEVNDSNYVIAHRIDMPPCHTIYEFLNKLNAQILETLLFNAEEKQFVPVYNTGDFHANGSYMMEPYSESADHRNMFSNANGDVLNDGEPIAYFKILMDSDYRFRVEMNHAFAKMYYIKMSPALFNMLGFVENKSNPFFSRTDLPGRRFMGDRIGQMIPRRLNQQDFQRHTKPPYTFNMRDIQTFTQQQTLAPGQFHEIQKTHSVNVSGFAMRDMICTFESALSSADSYNRIKSIVFSSSLATTSEGATGNTYRRFLTDFTIPTRSSFSYNPNTGESGPVSENAASEVTYTNPNPSAGRFLMLSDPSPLYEIKVDCHVKVFNFETGQFEFEPIPLPIGGTFSCKLVFISRSELYRRDRPDRLKA